MSGYAGNTVFSFDLFQRTIKKSILNQYNSLLYLSTPMACYTKFDNDANFGIEDFSSSKNNYLKCNPITGSSV